MSVNVVGTSQFFGDLTPAKSTEKILPVLTAFVVNYNLILFLTCNSTCKIEISISDKNLTYYIFLQEWPEDDCMRSKHSA
jgi:hypothetical protein